MIPDTSATIPEDRIASSSCASASGCRRAGEELEAQHAGAWRSRAALLRDAGRRDAPSRPCLNWWPGTSAQPSAWRADASRNWSHLLAARRLAPADLGAGLRPLRGAPGPAVLQSGRPALRPPAPCAITLEAGDDSMGLGRAPRTRAGRRRHRRKLSRQRPPAVTPCPRRRPAAANVGARRDSARAARPAPRQVGQQAAPVHRWRPSASKPSSALAGPRFLQHHVEQLDLLQRQRIAEHEGTRLFRVSASCRRAACPGGCARRPRYVERVARIAHRRLLNNPGARTSGRCWFAPSAQPRATSPWPAPALSAAARAQTPNRSTGRVTTASVFGPAVALISARRAGRSASVLRMLGKARSAVVNDLPLAHAWPCRAGGGRCRPDLVELRFEALLDSRPEGTGLFLGAPAAG